jgi:hypothetical protein
MKQNFIFNPNLDNIVSSINNELLQSSSFFFDDLYFDEKDSYYKNIKQNIKQNINLENLEKVLKVQEKINYNSYDSLEVSTGFHNQISCISYNLNVGISPKNKTITFTYTPIWYAGNKEVENLSSDIQNLFLKIKITLVFREDLEIKIHRSLLK